MTAADADRRSNWNASSIDHSFNTKEIFPKTRSIDDLKFLFQVSKDRNKEDLREKVICKRERRQTQLFVAKPSNDEPIDGRSTWNASSIGSRFTTKEILLALRDSKDNNSYDDGDIIKKGYKIRKAFKLWYDGRIISDKPRWKHCSIENEDFEV